MSRIQLIPIVLAAALLSTACASTKAVVRYQSDSSFNPSTHRTYFLVQNKVSTVKGLGHALEDVVHEKLKERGYKKVPQEQASVIVIKKVLLSGKPHKGSIEKSGSSALDSADVHGRSHEKTMVVMFQEPKTYRILWAGWSHMKIEEMHLVNTAKDMISKIVSKLPQAK